MRAWIAVLAVPAILAGAGCTGTDVLNPGNFEVQFQPVAANDGTDFECVLWNVNELRVQPADGDCEGGSNDGEPCGREVDCPGGTCAGALVGDTITELGVVREGLNRVNFSDPGESCDPLGTTAIDVPSVVLSSGRYRISSLELGIPTLVDSHGDSIVCQGYAVDAAPLLGDSVIFRVGPAERNVVRIVTHAGALEDAVDEPCDHTAFTAAIPSIVEIR
jgi:hypothetical protein